MHMTFENILNVILLRDLPLLKLEFLSPSEFLVDFPVDIFRTAEKSNPLRFAGKQELIDL